MAEKVHPAVASTIQIIANHFENTPMYKQAGLKVVSVTARGLLIDKDGQKIMIGAQVCR